MVKLYSLSYGPSTRYLTQIRLGLSKLNLHLFTHGIIPDPSCPSCPNSEKETPMHYFLQCPAYAALRGEMLRGLQDLLAPESRSNNKILLKAIIFGIENATPDINKSIFRIVSLYINETKRFIKL